MQVHIAKLAQLSERLLALYGGQRRFRVEAGTVRLAGSLRRPHFWSAETSPIVGTKSTDSGVGVLPAASDKAPELSCADRDWLDAVARAPGDNHPLLLTEAEKLKWEEKLLDIKRIYLTRHDRHWGLPRQVTAATDLAQAWDGVKTQPLLKSGQPAPPNLKHYSALCKAADNLLAKLAPFEPMQHGGTLYLLNGWWHLNGQPGPNQEILRALTDHVKGAMTKARQMGRQPIDKDAIYATYLLLPCYTQGFGTKPVSSGKGPTSRFLWTFFEGILGEWESRLRPGKRFCTIDLAPRSMLALIVGAKAYRDVQTHAQRLDDSEGLFPEPYRRPSGWKSHGNL